MLSRVRSGRFALKRRRPKPSDILTLLMVVAIAAAVLSLLPASYYMLLPGDARPVARMIHIQGYSPVPSQGGLFMTDVTVYKVNHKLEELYGRINPNADLEPVQAVAGNLSENQYLHVNALAMTDSIQEAEIAALSVLGRYKLSCSALRPQIGGVLPHTPAGRLLQPGDIIERVGTRTPCGSPGLFPLIRRMRPGAVLDLTVLRGNRTRVFHVRTIPGKLTRSGLLPSARGKIAMMGVALQDTLVPGAVHLPVKIHINPGDTVGPSAGLMFTLGIVEQLKRQDITHGCKIAGTGTVDYLGQVGEIGGAKQKIIAARGAGAEYFLVPNTPGNVAPARAHRGHVTVIPVNTARVALAALMRIKPCH
ncbi:MAG: S16 family serine protease [Chloroflexota bacterium]